MTPKKQKKPGAKAAPKPSPTPTERAKPYSRNVEEYKKEFLSGKWPSLLAFSIDKKIPKGTIYRWASEGKWTKVKKKVHARTEEKVIERLATQEARIIEKKRKQHLDMASLFRQLAMKGLLKKNKKTRKLELVDASVQEALRAGRYSIEIERKTLDMGAGLEVPDPGDRGLTTRKPAADMTRDEIVKEIRRVEGIINASRKSGKTSKP